MRNADERWQGLIEKKLVEIAPPRPYMHGDTQRFMSISPFLSALRSKYPFYYGDWECAVVCSPRCPLSPEFQSVIPRPDLADLGKARPYESLDDFIASIFLQKYGRDWGKRIRGPSGFENYQSSFSNTLPHPCDILWQCINFGTFLWDFDIIPRQFGVMDLPITCQNRVFSEFLPGADISTVRDEYSHLIEYIQNDTQFHQKPRLAVKNCIIQEITSWYNMLVEILTIFKTLGNFSLPGAHDPIQDEYIHRFDGNTKILFVQTARSYYYFYSATS
jgi:hypothetical protein